MLKDDKDGGWADGEKNRREALNGRLTPFWLMMGPPTLSFVLASSLRSEAGWRHPTLPPSPFPLPTPFASRLPPQARAPSLSSPTPHLKEPTAIDPSPLSLPVPAFSNPSANLELTTHPPPNSVANRSGSPSSTRQVATSSSIWLLCVALGGWTSSPRGVYRQALALAWERDGRRWQEAELYLSCSPKSTSCVALLGFRPLTFPLSRV